MLLHCTYSIDYGDYGCDLELWSDFVFLIEQQLSLDSSDRNQAQIDGFWRIIRNNSLAREYHWKHFELSEGNDWNVQLVDYRVVVVQIVVRMNFDWFVSIHRNQF